MTDFTTAQLATVLSALAGSERKPATKAAAMRAITARPRPSTSPARRCSPPHPGCSTAGSIPRPGASS